MPHLQDDFSLHVSSLAAHYTEAWNSQDSTEIVAHYAPSGSLMLNGAEPVVGHAALAALFETYFVALPDGKITNDLVRGANGKAIYCWTHVGTNTGPGGTGNRVRFSGWEAWTFDAQGLASLSIGTYDAAEYERQLAEGIN